MWNSYFFQMQKKYNMRISTKLPLVVRFDGKQVTKNDDINLLDDYKGSFFYSLRKTAEYFSNRYNCFAILGSDEISFIILDPNIVIKDLEPSDKTTHSQELIAMFSQYFFDYFNHFDVHRKIFWHGKCFSIPEGKIGSYLKYRSKIICNVLVTYFAKRNNINDVRLNLLDKLKVCKGTPNYKALEKVLNGVLYYDGNEIDLDAFLTSGEVKLKNNDISRGKTTNYVDIEDIDIELL